MQEDFLGGLTAVDIISKDVHETATATVSVGSSWNNSCLVSGAR